MHYETRFIPRNCFLIPVIGNDTRPQEAKHYRLVGSTLFTEKFSFFPFSFAIILKVAFCEMV
jgi:hypothetical protein